MKYFLRLTCVLIINILSSVQAFADVGIVVALNATWDEISKLISIQETKTIAKREFVSGRIENRNVVLVRSPMGKVNNAITAQLLISNYSIDYVVSVSPAGAIGEDVAIGDLVVADSLFHHDFGTIKPYGFIVSRVPEGINWDEKEFSKVNNRLKQKVLSYKGKIEKSQNTIHEGVVVSGDQFISSVQKKEWLRKKYNAGAVDMGAAAIGQVCQANGKQVCIIRVITDKADVVARENFEQSVDAYKTDINLAGLIKNIVHE